MNSSSSTSVRNAAGNNNTLNSNSSRESALKNLLKKPQFGYIDGFASPGATSSSYNELAPSSLNRTYGAAQAGSSSGALLAPSSQYGQIQQQIQRGNPTSPRGGSYALSSGASSSGAYTSPLRSNTTSTNINSNGQQQYLNSPTSSRLQGQTESRRDSNYNYETTQSPARKSSCGQTRMNEESSSTQMNKRSPISPATTKMQQMLNNMVGKSTTSSGAVASHNYTSNQISQHLNLSSSPSCSSSPRIAVQSNSHETSSLIQNRQSSNHESHRNEVSSLRSRDSSTSRNSSGGQVQSQNQHSQRSQQNISPLRCALDQRQQQLLPSFGGSLTTSHESSAHGLSSKQQTSSAQQVFERNFNNKPTTSQNATSLIQRSNSKLRLTADQLIEATYNTNRSVTPRGTTNTTAGAGVAQVLASKQKTSTGMNLMGNTFGNVMAASPPKMNNIQKQKTNDTLSGSGIIDSDQSYNGKSKGISGSASSSTLKINQSTSIHTKENSRGYQDHSRGGNQEVMSNLQQQQHNLRVQQSEVRQSSRSTTPNDRSHQSSWGAVQSQQSQSPSSPSFYPIQNQHHQQQQQQSPQRSTSPIERTPHESSTQKTNQTSHSTQKAATSNQSQPSASCQTMKKASGYTQQADVIRAIQEQLRVKNSVSTGNGTVLEWQSDKEEFIRSPGSSTKRESRDQTDLFESNYFQFNPEAIHTFQQSTKDSAKKSLLSNLQRSNQTVSGSKIPGKHAAGVVGEGKGNSTESHQQQSSNTFFSSEDCEYPSKQLSSESSRSSIKQKNVGASSVGHATSQKISLDSQKRTKASSSSHETDNHSVESTSTATGFSEELSKSTIAKLNLSDILSIEASLFDLQKHGFSQRSTVTRKCKNYLHIIAEQSADSLERICSDVYQCGILTRMFVLERICIMLSLNESLKNGCSESGSEIDSQSSEEDDDSTEQIGNTLQYVHQNFLLFLDLAVSKYNFAPEQAALEARVRGIFEERMKTKRYAALLNKQDKFQMISNYCDIILPYLKNVVHNYQKEPFLAVASIIKNIATATVAHSTQILMESFAKIIIELEVRASKESHRTSQESMSSQSSSQSKQDISFENTRNSKFSKKTSAEKNLEKISSAKPTPQTQGTQKQKQQQQQLAMQQTQTQNQTQTKSSKLSKSSDDKDNRIEGGEIPSEDATESESDESINQARGSMRVPFLPNEIRSGKKYTLVLDLDETLVHYEEYSNTGGQFLIRPNADRFLKIMAQYYEIVIFTAAVKSYADFILDVLDEGNISHRLYRQHTDIDGRGFVKDISKLGRDLSKTIIIDNLPENFQRQPKNGILISSWMEIPKSKKFRDVRDALQKYREQMMNNLIDGVQDPHIHLVLDEID